MSIDGRIALKNGKSKWITNEESRSQVHSFRAEFDLDELIKNLDKNRPLRLSLSGVFSELPVPPFVVKEWRSIN